MTSTPSRIAYADCFSGVSGDMFLGALLHCGFDENVLRKELNKLDLGKYSITITSPTIFGIGSRQIDIKAEEKQRLRDLPTIKTILEESTLDEDIATKAIMVFTELAKAEAKVHQMEIEKIHFHEVGALDTIIDIVGTICGLRYLGVERLICAPLPNPKGFVKCAHGNLPLPAPAVCELLQGIPCYGVELDKEMVTPTGAALIKVLADDFGPMPPMTIEATGYGAGTNDLSPTQPNLFRLFVGSSLAVSEEQQVEVIETNIDDFSPEGFPHLFELLFSRGALDVSLAPIQMKKGRPGFRLQVIASLQLAPELRGTILSETSAIGLRYRREARQTLPRELIKVETPWGKIGAKEVVTPKGVVIYPEYEECRKISLEHDVALMEVYDYIRRSGDRG